MTHRRVHIFPELILLTLIHLPSLIFVLRETTFWDTFIKLIESLVIKFYLLAAFQLFKLLIGLVDIFICYLFLLKKLFNSGFIGF